MLSTLKTAWMYLKWPLALGVVVYLGWQSRTHLHTLSERTVSLPLLATAFTILLSSTLLTFFRWYLLVRGAGLPFRITDAVRLGFLGLMFNYVGPGAVGGDLFKAVALAKEQSGRRSVAVATVLLDRILGLLALFLLGSVTAIIITDVPKTDELLYCKYILWAGSLAGLAGIAVMLSRQAVRLLRLESVSRWPIIGGTWAELLRGVQMYQSRPGIVLLSVLLSVISHAGLIVGFYIGGMSVEPWLPTLAQHLFFMPIAESVTAIVPVNGGVGALEYSVQQFCILFAPGANVSAETAGGAGLVTCIMYRLMTIGIAAVGILYYVSSRSEIQQTMVAAETQPGT